MDPIRIQAQTHTDPDLDLDPQHSDSISVADPGCLSRILIFTHSGSRIPDPKHQQKRGGKKLVVKPFFLATNFTKLIIILLFKCWRKKFGPVFEEL
jgi:hypothetical protein